VMRGFSVLRFSWLVCNQNKLSGANSCLPGGVEWSAGRTPTRRPQTEFFFVSGFRAPLLFETTSKTVGCVRA
jgi:hypothetical protein